ncbi:hypothetical protein ACVWY3_005545 [Bradyrhizobium sp. USDA 4486]
MQRSGMRTEVGDGLSIQALPMSRDHPTPLALRAIDPPPPGEGGGSPLRRGERLHDLLEWRERLATVGVSC